MNRQLRHDLWVSAVLLAVGVIIGGVLYHIRIRNDELSQSNGEVFNSPDGLKIAHDRAKAAQSVPLANATPTKPLVLAAPVTIKPDNQPAVLPLATAGKVVDDDVQARPAGITSLGPSPSSIAHVTQSALVVRKAAAAVPLASVGSVAPAKLSIPLVTVNGGSAVSLPAPVRVSEERTERETPNPVAIGSGTRAWVPVVEVAARDDEPHAAARTAARSVSLAGVSLSTNEPATQLLPTAVVTIPSQPAPAPSVAPVAIPALEQAPPEIARPSLSASRASSLSALAPVRIINVEVPEIIRVDIPSKRPGVSVDLVSVTMPAEPTANLPATTPAKSVRPKLDIAPVSVSAVTDIRGATGTPQPISLGTVRSPDSFKLDTEPISASQLEHGINSANLLAPAEIGSGHMPALPEAAAIHVFHDPVLPDPALPGKPTPDVPGVATITLTATTGMESRPKSNELTTAKVQPLQRRELSVAVLETNRPYVYIVGWLPLPKMTEVVWDTDRAPADPLASIQSFTDAESALVEWIKKWKDDIYAELRQDSGPKTQDTGLETLLSQTSLTCTQLYEIGHGIKYVEGMAGAAPFYRAAVGKAERELQGHTPGDTNDLAVIHALAHMGNWFPIQDRVYPTLARIFRLIRDNTPVDNGLYLRSSMLLANSLYDLGRGVDKSMNLKAAEVLRAMLQHPEVQKWPRVNQDSLHLGLASALYQGLRYAEAVPEFEIFLASGNLRDAGWARQFHVMALANAGQIEEAKHHYQIWITEAKPSKRSEDYVAQVIQVAEQKYSTGAVKSGKAN